MGELHVYVDNQPNTPIAVSTTNTPATASNVKITDGAAVVSVTSNGFTGNSLATYSGFATQAATLSSVSANATGAAVDGGSARSNWAGYAFGTGTLTGTLTIELSADGGNFVSSTATAALTAAGSVGVFSTGRAARYARVSLSGASGTGTVTVNMMGA